MFLFWARTIAFRQVTERTATLNHSLETLKSAQPQLVQSEKLTSLNELTAGIAHEIQNPLNFVNNFSELSVDLTKEIKEEMDKEAIDKAFVYFCAPKTQPMGEL